MGLIQIVSMLTAIIELVRMNLALVASWGYPLYMGLGNLATAMQNFVVYVMFLLSLI